MKRTLQVIVILGVILRVGAALYQGNGVESLPGVADQISYHELAVRVLDGHGFSFGKGWWPATAANQPTAHWSYLYVLFLSSVYFVFGPNPIAARLIQAVATGILQPLITWRIARRLFGPRVGVLSAALTSFYAYFVFYSGALVTESLHVIAVLWVVDISTALVVSSSRDQSVRKLKLWGKLGIAFGMASLLRQVFLPLVPAILAWIIWHLIREHHLADESPKISVRSLIGRVALTLLVLFACIVPWTIRNYRSFGQFVLLNTNAGYAFFAGNHPIHGTEFIPILPGPGSGYARLLPDGLRGLNEAQLERVLLARGVEFVKNDPARYALLSISRAKEYFKFWPSRESGILSNCMRVLSFGLLLPFLLSGVYLALFHRNAAARQKETNGVALLLLVSTLYTLVHLLTWTLVRYRLPFDAVTMPFAALSLIYVFDHLFSPRQVTGFQLVKSAE